MTITKQFLIQGPIDSFDNEQLFWSNQIGWVSRQDANIFESWELPEYFPTETIGILLLPNFFEEEEFIPISLL